MNALQFLEKLVSYASVSTLKANQPQLKKIVVFLEKTLKDFGFVVKLVGTTHPLIYAYQDNQAQETVGFYAHYDVQPIEPLSKWKSPPFKLTAAGNKLFGRGVADDKGHIAQILAALTNTPREKRKNIVLLFEGEEELGSLHFEEYLKKIINNVPNINVFYVLDAGVRDAETPMIEYGLRGLAAYTLKIKVASHDLHSGLAGNLVANPANILASLVASLKDKNGKVTLPHFYDNVLVVSETEDKLLQKSFGSLEKKLLEFGAKAFYLPSGAKTHLASKVFPSFDVNGIQSGYSEEGFKTIIPAEGVLKFSFRLVPKQEGQKIDGILRQYVADFLSQYPVQYELKGDYSEAFLTDISSKEVAKTEKIFTQFFANKMVYNRSGGSIPAAEVLGRHFKFPIVITGFTSDDSRLHSPNENIDAALFEKGEKVLGELVSR